MVLIMPTYDIQNKKTGETKEVFCSYNDKEKTLKEEGPDWEYIIGAPSITYEEGGIAGSMKRAGSGWNDVLTNIKKGADPKRCTIETD